MKSVINNASFGDIGTIVFYPWYKYIPDTIEASEITDTMITKYTSNLVKYKASTSLTGLEDLASYEFGYDIIKEKYNSTLLLSQIDKTTSDLVGIDSEDLEQLEKVMFSTYSDEPGVEGMGYYGTMLVGTQTLLLTDAPEECWKIELYEGPVTGNSKTRSGFIDSEILEALGDLSIMPAVTITLGPDRDNKYNSPDMYWSSDSSSSTSGTSIVNYRKELAEITGYNIFWITISTEDEVSDINLSYRSWINSINPNRNMNNWALRRDDFKSLSKSIGVIAEEGNFWVDQNSGNLLGSQGVVSTPILDQKLSSMDTRVYNPYVVYKRSEEIIWAGETWSSLIDDNYLNKPGQSTAWGRTSDIKAILMTRVNVTVMPNEAGVPNPSGTMSINTSDSKSFIITNSLGYKLSDTAPCLYAYGDAYKVSNYSKTTSASGTYYTVTIAPAGWGNIMSTGTLIFNFERVASEITLKATSGNSIYQQEDWSTWMSDSGIKLEKIFIDGIDSGTITKANVGAMVELYFSTNTGYSITGASTTMTIGTDISTEELTVSEDEGYYVIADTIDFNNASYLLVVGDTILDINVVSSQGYEVSDPTGHINYGCTYILEFYSDVVTFTSLALTNINTQEVITFTEPGVKGNNTLVVSKNGMYALTMKNLVSNWEIQIN